MPYVLLRGRHMVGPSPALASVVEKLISDRRSIGSVLDLFAGTGIVSKVVCKLGNPKEVVIVEKDPIKVARMSRYLRDPRVRFTVGDATLMKLPRKPFDLVVADPYYEDALEFLSNQLSWITARARLFLLVSGGVEDLEWNNDVRVTLRRGGLKDTAPVEFVQVCFESTKGGKEKV